jgi:branched-chain amino acid transport system ATP-binding protein
MLDVNHLNAWWGAIPSSGSSGAVPGRPKQATAPLGGSDDTQCGSVGASSSAAQALFDVSLKVAAGELVVLQGLNGTGKSTLLQAIIGIGPQITGTISYQNSSIENWPAHRRAQAGLGFVAEDRRLFAGLSVKENLDIAARGDVASNFARALDLFPALKSMLARPASQMSGGEQQMLAIARTLMTAPKLLLLDEPCEGIAPVLVESIAEALLGLRNQGMPMLVAEQNQILANRADRVITLAAGQVTDRLTDRPTDRTNDRPTDRPT